MIICYKLNELSPLENDECVNTEPMEQMGDSKMVISPGCTPQLFYMNQFHLRLKAVHLFLKLSLRPFFFWTSIF